MTAEHPELDIHIIGINERGHEVGNAGITEGRDLPWLQDVDDDGDGQSDTWLNSWDVEYRDVVIVGPDNVQVDVFNVTSNDLSKPENFEALTEIIVDVAQSSQTPEFPWQNPADPLDVNRDGSISPIDALLIINILNSDGAGELPLPTSENSPPPFVDSSGDGFVSAIDALLVINHINASFASGEPVAAVAADVPLSNSSSHGQMTTGSVKTLLQVPAREVVFESYNRDLLFDDLDWFNRPPRSVHLQNAGAESESTTEGAQTESIRLL